MNDNATVKSAAQKSGRTILSSNTVVGLDLGTSSIGWSVIQLDRDGEPIALLGAGARIFQKMIEDKTGVPKNQKRRTARGMRRRLFRIKQRRTKLIGHLILNDLLPADAKARVTLLADHTTFDPYRLRKEGLDRVLTPFELGRAVFHLNQRRGFQSNRKSKADDENGVVKPAIEALALEISSAGARTLGEYLYSQTARRNRNHSTPRYTSRDMYKAEFDAIWRAQIALGNSRCTPALGVELHRIIFFQRPLKSVRGMVGKCSLEPDKRRGLKATFISQEFRLLQDVNSLRIKSPENNEERILGDGERHVLMRLARQQKGISWAGMRKALGLKKSEKFNLERVKDDGLKGLSSEIKIREVIGKEFDQLTPPAIEQLLTDLLTIESAKGILNRLVGFWGYSPEIAKQLSQLDFESGFGALSNKAMLKLLPLMREGMRYDEARQEIYPTSLRREVGSRKLLGMPPKIANPLVQKALFETRKVVNAIIKRFGLPRAFRVEMARDLKNGPTARKEIEKTQKERKKQRDRARAKIIESGIIPEPKAADIELYLLWEEAREVCPYTGRSIGLHQLFSGEINTEHILPYSRTLNDSFANKTLAFANINAAKGNKTPYEMYGGSDLWEQLLARINNFPENKRRRFMTEKLENDDFVNRHLNDTAYISREVKTYLGELASDVTVSRGSLTHALNDGWALYRHTNPNGDNIKNRDDHRHHAIDATAIALTSPTLLRRMSTSWSRRDHRYGTLKLKLNEPWPTFNLDVQQCLQKMLVSHATDHRLKGALHEETCYGVRKIGDKSEKVQRLPVAKAATNIDSIIDPVIRRQVELHIADFEGDLKKAFTEGAKPVFHKNGTTPIKKVRCYRGKVNPRSIVRKNRGSQHFDLGNNHSVEVRESTKLGRYSVAVRSTLQVAEAMRRGIQIPLNADDGKLINHFIINDTVRRPEPSDSHVYRIQKIAISGERGADITLRSITSASTDVASEPVSVRITSPRDLAALRPIRLDVLGEASDDKAHDRDLHPSAPGGAS